MVIQDDTREVELLDLFQLERPHDAGRAGTDAILRLKTQLIQFELKSTIGGLTLLGRIKKMHRKCTTTYDYFLLLTCIILELS